MTHPYNMYDDYLYSIAIQIPYSILLFNRLQCPTHTPLPFNVPKQNKQTNRKDQNNNFIQMFSVLKALVWIEKHLL